MAPRLPYLRLLFWLKLKLTWRTYTRSTSALLGAILLLVFFAPMAAGIGIGSYLGFTELGRPLDEHLLRAILLGLYLMWVSSPILGYALTEEYDVSKLLLYPLSPRQLLAGATLGSVADFGAMLMAPALGAALIAFSASSVAFPLVLLGLAAFVFHMLTLTEAVRLASAGIMRTRRARDLLLLLIPIVSMAFYLLTQVLSRRAMHYDWRAILHSPAWEAISFLPPGLAARSIAAAGRGDYMASAGFLAATLALAAGTLALSGWLMPRIYTGDASGGSAARRPARPAAVPVERMVETRLPPAIAAVLDKELKHLRRDPYYKQALLQSLYRLVVIAVGSFGSAHGSASLGRTAGGAALWTAVGVLLAMESQLTFNIFGVEGAAAATLFLFPTSRRQVLIGKNAALFLVLSGANGVVAVAGAAMLGQLHLLPQLLVWMELALVILISGGNLSSIWFPATIIIRKGVLRPRVSLNAGQIALSAVAFFIVALVGLPALGAALVPTYWVSRWWLLVTLPAAGLYVALAYLFSLHLAESLLLAREPELIEKLKPAD